MLYQKIGKRIRTRRIEKFLTQEQLSKQTGISLSFLGHIERGTRKMSVDTLYKLAIALGCSADELMDTGLYNMNGLTITDLLNNAIDRLSD